MAHASGVRRLTSHASHASGVRRPTSNASGVRRHASGVRRHASDSWLTPHASGVRRHASHVPRVRRQASHVPRPSFSPFSRRPLSVMTTTKRRRFPHSMPSYSRLLSCTAWGNRVVLPTLYSPTGAIVRIKTGRGAPLSAAACFYSYEKGRHNAGPVPEVVRLVGNLLNGYFRS